MIDFENPEIRGWFVPRVVPYGGAPKEIKRGWVDVPLPIRYDMAVESPQMTIGHDINSVYDITVFESGVVVASVDAVRSLRLFERHQAADWWEEYFGDIQAQLTFGVEAEDQVLPDSLMRLIMPGIEGFDQLDSEN